MEGDDDEMMYFTLKQGIRYAPTFVLLFAVVLFWFSSLHRLPSFLLSYVMTSLERGGETLRVGGGFLLLLHVERRLDCCQG